MTDKTVFQTLLDSAMEAGEELVKLKRSMPPREYELYMLSSAAHRLTKWLDGGVDVMVRKEVSLIVVRALNLWPMLPGESAEAWARRIRLWKMEPSE